MAELRDELARGRLGCRMHTVLRHFVDAPRRRLLVTAIKMIERAGALADGKAVFDSLNHIRFRQHYGFAEPAP